MNSWEDIFYISSDNYGYYAVFKHNGEVLNNMGPCEWPVYAESIAFNWCCQPANQKKILDIMMELTICE